VYALLQAADVWFAYDDRSPASTAVLKGLTLGVPDDGFVGILGPNGAGKSTLLRLLAGTRRPQRGTITLDRTPLAQFSRTALARRMAVVPQETHLAFDYTVGEVAMMGRYPHLGTFEIEGPGDLSIVDRALAATGTSGFKHRPFETLSGGEKQRVIIAAALAQLGADGRGSRGSSLMGGRGILLLDEPTASLDLAYQLEIAGLLEALHRDQGVAVVLSTHDLNLAAGLCRTLVLMRDGQVLAAGSTPDVLTVANIKRLYDVDAEIVEHPSGHRVVIPLAHVATGPKG
jgi:iron complex transport system ATP-binding protein